MYVLDLIKICLMNTTFSCSVVSLYLTPPPIFYTDLSVLKKRTVERLGGGDRPPLPPPLATPLDNIYLQIMHNIALETFENYPIYFYL